VTADIEHAIGRTDELPDKVESLLLSLSSVEPVALMAVAVQEDPVPSPVVPNPNVPWIDALEERQKDTPEEPILVEPHHYLASPLS
jgi:hypothetical protein